MYWPVARGGVGVPWSPCFDTELETSYEGDNDSRPYLFYRDVRSFVAVYLTSVQFILQLKLCLYTIVHILLGEFKISLKSSTHHSTQSLCHTISPRVGVPQKARTPHPCSGAGHESTEGGSVPNGVGYGEGVPSPAD